MQLEPSLMTLIRRKFLTTAALSGGVLSAPSLVQAQSKGTFN